MSTYDYRRERVSVRTIDYIHQRAREKMLRALHTELHETYDRIVHGDFDAILPFNAASRRHRQVCGCAR